VIGNCGYRTGSNPVLTTKIDVMENNLMEIALRYQHLKSEMLHGGYTGEMLDNHVTDVISDEILSELGEIERYEEVKRALVNMFYIGQMLK
jgi:hypothetical protein